MLFWIFKLGKMEIRDKINKIITNLNRTIIDLSKDIDKIYDINIDEINDKLNDNDTGSYIYVINCNLKGTIDEIKNKVIIERGKLKNFAISKINSNNWKQKDTENICLYVGSSKEIKKRLKQHLFADEKKYKTTFSLKLNKLDENNEFFENIKVNLFLFKIEDYELVKYFEAKLWYELKPLFGQKCNK